MSIVLCQAPYSVNDGRLLLDQPKMKTICLWLIPVLILLLLGLNQVDSKKYQRCELTRVLVENYNFDKTFISNCKWFAYEFKNFITKDIMDRDLPGGARELPGHQENNEEGERKQELWSVPDQQQGLLHRR